MNARSPGHTQAAAERCTHETVQTHTHAAQNMPLTLITANTPPGNKEEGKVKER